MLIRKKTMKINLDEISENDIPLLEGIFDNDIIYMNLLTDIFTKCSYSTIECVCKYMEQSYPTIFTQSEGFLFKFLINEISETEDKNTIMNIIKYLYKYQTDFILTRLIFEDEYKYKESKADFYEEKVEYVSMLDSKSNLKSDLNSNKKSDEKVMKTKNNICEKNMLNFSRRSVYASCIHSGDLRLIDFMFENAKSNTNSVSYIKKKAFHLLDLAIKVDFENDKKNKTLALNKNFFDNFNELMKFEINASDAEIDEFKKTITCDWETTSEFPLFEHLLEIISRDFRKDILEGIQLYALAGEYNNEELIKKVVTLTTKCKKNYFNDFFVNVQLLTTGEYHKFTDSCNTHKYIYIIIDQYFTKYPTIMYSKNSMKFMFINILRIGGRKEVEVLLKHRVRYIFDPYILWHLHKNGCIYDNVEFRDQYIEHILEYNSTEKVNVCKKFILSLDKMNLLNLVGWMKIRTSKYHINCDDSLCEIKKRQQYLEGIKR